MDCDLARQLLDFARPGVGELEAHDVAELDQHLASCPDCRARVRVERTFDAALVRAMRTVPLPDRIGVRLQTRLLAARMAWWRRTLLWTLTIVVAFLLGGAAMLHSTRPTLDPSTVIQKAYELTGPGHTHDETRDAVTAWLRQIDGTLRAPDEFNYKLLAFPEQSEFQGLRAVPMLVFVRGEATMRVYAVRERAFKNLHSLAEQPFEDMGCSLAVRRYADMPGWVFVVVTAGAPPEVFRRPERADKPM